MTNQEIANRIPYLKEQVKQNESDLRFGVRTIRQYWDTNYYLVAEVDNLIEQAEENNRREKFDEMMGNPLKALGELFK